MAKSSRCIPFFLLLMTFGCNSNPVQAPIDRARVELRKTSAIDGATQIDMLWVIDNSGSMCQEQDVLARNFDLFVEEIDKTNLDFHIGVTTTDMETLFSVDPVSNPGHLQATPQPVPSPVDRTCINAVSETGVPIDGNFDPITKSIDRAIACMETPSDGFVPSNADIACALFGTPTNCEIAGVCGGAGKRCVKNDLFPRSDQYRKIPSVLKAKDYKDGNRLNVERLKADFSCMSFVGTLGWGVEKGLSAALEATSPELTGGPVDDPESALYNTDAVNHGLLRKNSRFALILVSDENDCSDDGSLDIQGLCDVAVCEYANIEGRDEGLLEIENIKANLIENLSVSKNRPDFDASEILVASIHGTPDRFTASRIPEVCEADVSNDGVKPVCANIRGVAYSGDRYQRFLQSFNEGNYYPAAGDSEQGWLCAGDFAPVLTAIGTFIGNTGSGCITESIFPCDDETVCPSFPFSGEPGTCVDRPGSENKQKYCDSGIQVRAELLSPTQEKLGQLEARGYCVPGSLADSEFPDGCVVSPDKYDFIACPADLPGVKLSWVDQKDAKIALAETLVEIRFNALSSQ